jgi:hypothetical protein
MAERVGAPFWYAMRMEEWRGGGGGGRADVVCNKMGGASLCRDL